MIQPKLRITQRDLPHWEIDGAVYFVTFKTWEKLELVPSARQIVLDACKFFNNQRYRIFVVVVMPDHVHMLIQPLLISQQKVWSLSSIMHSIKSYSAKLIPKAMPHIGGVWQPERYDRIVRNQQEFEDIWEYIRQNPVKAELSATPEAYFFFWQQSRQDFWQERRQDFWQERRQDAYPTIDYLPTRQQSRQDACPTIINLPQGGKDVD